MPAGSSPDIEIAKAVIAAIGTVIAALAAAGLAAFAAWRITGRIQRERNAQDRESEWRTHAIELTKLDAERLFKASGANPRLKPFILTFLANYRDLQELRRNTQEEGIRSPGELWEIIQDRRTNSLPPKETILLSGVVPSFVCCEGGDKDGHPAVYMILIPGKPANCGYCNREYVLPM